MTLHDIIEKISMNDYTRYEIRLMLEKLANKQAKGAKEILENALSYKNCEGLISEGSRLEDAVLYAISDALSVLPTTQEEQKSPFVEDGLLAIPEEHIFDNLTEQQ